MNFQKKPNTEKWKRDPDSDPRRQQSACPGGHQSK